MKKNILILDRRKNPLAPLLKEGLPDYNFNDIKNIADLLATIDKNQPVAIIIAVPSLRSNRHNIPGQIKTQSGLLDVPVLSIVATNNPTGEASWYKSGIDDIIYETGNKKHLCVKLQNRLNSCLKLHRYRNQNKSLEKKLRQKTNELFRTQVEIVQRLSMAAEHRDPETGDHIHRMSHYCYCIALAFGIPEKESKLLQNASPMHDIGKLAIPDSILLTPDELSSEEWKIMKGHAEIGARILEGSESKLVQLGQIVAGTHHEKWDGTGYPKGLTGEGIPVWGRIAALADVFDAMTTKRVYQNPVSVDKAFKYIKKQKGKHFDPDMANLFLNIKNEVLAIRKKFPN